MKITGHFMSMSGASGALRALREAKYDVEPQYFPRLLKMALLGLPMHPFGAAERALFNRAIARTDLAGPPIFILGHWRTGSTHVHNVLSHDPQFGYLSTYHALATNNFLLGRDAVKLITRKIMPEKRPMDDMDLRMDLPQEEEYAMANLSDLSYYKQFSFPRLSEHYARRHLFFEGVPACEIEEWKRTYDLLLRKITLAAGPKPLLLKNPPNTARLRYLLDLYPAAKVIYLYRDPVDLYLSTVRMRERMFETTQLQEISHEEISQHVLETYPRLLGRFFEDLPRVAPGCFVAVRYEEFTTRPLAELERIYAGLGLPGFAEARSRFESYLGTVAEYRPTRYSPDPAVSRMVEEHWGRTHALHQRFA